MVRFDPFEIPGKLTARGYAISGCANSEEALHAVREALNAEGSRLGSIQWATVEIDDTNRTLRAVSRYGQSVLTVDGVGLGYGSAGTNTAAILYTLARHGSFEMYLSWVQGAGERWWRTVTFEI